jgi:hypothetical protein
MLISKLKALLAAFGAILLLILVQAFNSFACYKHGVGGFLYSLTLVGIAVSPGLAFLLTKNPLRTVVAVVFVLPYLVFAYYTDCLRPYTGGGASMVYITVVLFGFPSALIGSLFAGRILRKMGISVV